MFDDHKCKQEAQRSTVIFIPDMLYGMQSKKMSDQQKADLPGLYAEVCSTKRCTARRTALGSIVAEIRPAIAIRFARRPHSPSAIS